MAETRAFLAAVGRYGATERQLRARGIDVRPLQQALRRGWIERYKYPEETTWCFRLTESGQALLR